MSVSELSGFEVVFHGQYYNFHASNLSIRTGRDCKSFMFPRGMTSLLTKSEQPPCTRTLGSRNILSSEASHTRWMSFHDHAARWDQRWHLELMAHSFAWWQQGKSPWDYVSSDGDSQDSTFSHRVNAWCVPGSNLKTIICFESIDILLCLVVR